MSGNPSFYGDGSTQNRHDTELVSLQKILGRVNNLLSLFSPVSTTNPSFFPEGSTARKSDTRWRILQKINGGLGNLETAILATGTPSSLGFFNVATVAALRTLATVVTNKAATVQSNTTAGDGMGGLYFWASGNTDADDGIATIRPSDYTTGGTWKKLV